MYFLGFGEATNSLHYLWRFYYKKNKFSFQYKIIALLFNSSFAVCRIFILPYYALFILPILYHNVITLYDFINVSLLFLILIVGIYWAFLINIKIIPIYTDLFRFLYPTLYIKSQHIITKRHIFDKQLLTHIPMIYIIWKHENYIIFYSSSITIIFSILYHYYNEKKFIFI